MTDIADDMKVVASAVAETSRIGTVGFGAVAIAGIRAGVRFAGLFDFATPFGTAKEAPRTRSGGQALSTARPYPIPVEAM